MTKLNNEQVDTYVIFNTATGQRYGSSDWGGYKDWDTASKAKGALTRLKKKHLKAFEDNTNQHMDYITKLYESGDTRSYDWGPNKYATQAGRDAYLEDMKLHNGDWRVYEGLCEAEVVTYNFFYENEPLVERTNISCGNKYMERLNTPSFMSPSCDSYYR